VKLSLVDSRQSWVRQVYQSNTGAGKTTFLNVLMGKVTRTDGELFINEVQADLSQFRKLIGYVPQEDTMLKELTVRENLLHSARIRAPSSWTEADCQAYIDALMRALKYRLF
jgi:ABC-type multidrug transport system ATPase subunit